MVEMVGDDDGATEIGGGMLVLHARRADRLAILITIYSQQVALICYCTVTT